MQITHPTAPFDPRAEGMLAGTGGFPKSDHDLFLAGYSELCREDLDGGHALEICGGFGKLAAALAGVFPDAKVTGLDLYAAGGPDADSALEKHPNLEYVAGDAFDLSRYPENSIDLVWGQAALHHLSHDLKGIARETSRVLKPGGRLVFIFEPLGHNLLVAAIRAMRMARHQLGDESNLYLSQFERIGESFARTEVQVFNLLGYPAKALADRLVPAAHAIKRADATLFHRFPKLMRYAANCNLIFTK